MAFPLGQKIDSSPIQDAESRRESICLRGLTKITQLLICVPQLLERANMCRGGLVSAEDGARRRQDERPSWDREVGFPIANSRCRNEAPIRILD